MRFPVLTIAACVLFAPALRAAPLKGHGLFRPGASAHAGAAVPKTQAPSAAVNFTFLDFPNTSYTAVYGLNLAANPNAKQLLVGSYGPGVAGSGDYTGFLLKVSTKKTVMSESYEAILPTMNSLFANTINDSGEIVGQFGADPQIHGFLLAHEKLTQIDAPYEGAVGTQTSGINNAGVIVGTWYTASGTAGGMFMWHHGAFTQIPADPGTSNPEATAINNGGDIVGGLDDSNGVGHGFLLHDGVYSLIDPPGSLYTIVNGINDSGAIVGQYCTTQDCKQTALQGFTFMNGTYTTINYPDAIATSLNDINDAGVVVGVYFDQAGFVHGFLINP
jgi:probable HAF family extracellular repeat protein